VRRRPFEAWLLVAADVAVGGGILWLALRHGERRDVLVHFFVYAGIVFVFKARNAAALVPQLVRAAQAPPLPVDDPWPRRVVRMLFLYDTWGRVERIGLLLITLAVCVTFGWDDGGPLAAGLFIAVAGVGAGLAAIATGARVVSRFEGRA
jgi:hypothetical protein